MTCKTIFMALVALALCLLVAHTAVGSAISQNAAVRRHANMIEARPARRSIDLAPGERLRQKRQTAEQLAQAAALKAWDDEFHRKNAEWQQAALAALAKGQTPPSFDEYWNGKDGDSGSDSGSSSGGDDTGDDTGSGSDSNQSDSSAGNSSSGSDSNGSSSGSSDSSSDSNGDSSDSTSSNPETASASSSSASPSATTSSTTDDAEDCDDEGSSTTTSSRAAAATSDAKQMAAAGPTSTSTTAAPTSTSSAPKSQMTGQGTYFATGLGACGQYNVDSDRIVAISHSLFDSFGTGNPNNNPVCGHKIKATYQGKSTTVTVVDRCEGCAWADLDFTETAFQDLSPLSAGRLYGVTWEWLGTAP